MNVSAFSFADIDPSVIQELTQFEDHFRKLCGKDVVLVAYEKKHAFQDAGVKL